MYKYKKIKLKNGKTRDEHRVIIEKAIGRTLSNNEVVHHINGEKKDNRIENLEILSKSEHIKLHHLYGQLHEFSKEESIMGLNKSHISQRKKIKNGKYFCSRCGKWKLPNEFHRRIKSWNSLQPYCKQCNR